jgi:predicted ATPase
VAGPLSLDIEATRLEELRLHAVEVRMEVDLELGEAAGLVDELEALVQRYPHRERLWRHLMLALYRSGRQADALAAYHRARARLEDELGIDPGLELQDLEAAILRQDVAIASPPAERHNLPIPVSTFIGREAELGETGDMLRDARLLTITGVGGVGKTRLALEVARAHLARAPDGVWFVDLAPLADPMLLAGEVAAALGIAERPGVTATEQVVDHVRRLHLLLVLDNCEHLRAACADLAATVLAAAGQVRILATSREPLAVPGEVEYPLQPLALADETADVGIAAASEAVRLFAARAHEARPSFTLQAGNLASVLKVCRDLDGLPLGIELAATKVRALSLSEIAARLDDRMRFLVSWRRIAPARHRTLRQAMDWSYDLLQADEQALLARLSVFSGSFTREAAGRVGLDGDEDRALTLIERLVEASLVVVQPEVEESRYRLLETVRQYAAAQLSDASVLARVRDRHAAYYGELAATWHGQVQALGSQVLTHLIPDEANLRAAIQYLQEQHRWADALRMASTMWRLWWLRGSINEGRGRLQEALLRAPEPSADRAEALRGASTLALRQLAVDDALALAEEGLAVATMHGQPFRARAMVALANALGSRGDLDRAQTLYEAAAAYFRNHGHVWELANCLLNMVDLALGRGDLATAEVLATESLGLTRQVDDKVGTLINLGNLGFASLERQETDRAGGLFDEALGFAKAVGFREFAGIVLVGVAAVACARGLDRRAATVLGSAERVLHDAGASLDSIERRWHDRTEAALRERLTEDEFQAARTAGRGMALGQALSFASPSEGGEAGAPS